MRRWPTLGNATDVQPQVTVLCPTDWIVPADAERPIVITTGTVVPKATALIRKRRLPPSAFWAAGASVGVASARGSSDILTVPTRVGRSREFAVIPVQTPRTPFAGMPHTFFRAPPRQPTERPRSRALCRLSRNEFRKHILTTGLSFCQQKVYAEQQHVRQFNKLPHRSHARQQPRCHQV